MTPRSNRPFVLTPAIAIIGFLALELPLAGGQQESGMVAPILSNPQMRTCAFTIPAPRGLIIDREGRVLAGNRSAAVLGVNLSILAEKRDLPEPEQDGWSEALVSGVSDAVEELRAIHAKVCMPPAAEVVSHWTHRRWRPLDVSGPLRWEELASAELPAWVQTQTVILRDYPQGRAGCHVIGYVSRESTVPRGPVEEGESLWPQVRGRAGLEARFEKELCGVDGSMRLLVNGRGEEVARYLVEEPVPGQTVVTTLDAAILELAACTLREKKRKGAIVALDAITGDVLALTSWPDFDPNHFVPAMSEEDFEALRRDPDAPLYPRAHAGSYPPGSVFKPVVALSTLRYSQFPGVLETFSCPPAVRIAGRTFHNWNDEHEGRLDLRGALIRSCNTWFYQAGIRVGADPIVRVAKAFGFGEAPSLPLEGVSEGRVPDSRMGQRATANLSIGQGDLLASPLQVTRAMAGFANKRVLPQTRLVSAIQSPGGEVLRSIRPAGRELRFRRSDLQLVEEGLYGVVNHPRGTARVMDLDEPVVLGKTGTAEWSDGGRKTPLYWFAGYTHTWSPRLAFAVMCEGREGEQAFSSRVAVPIAESLLENLYRNPGRYRGQAADRQAPKPERLAAGATPRPAAERRTRGR